MSYDRNGGKLPWGWPYGAGIRWRDGSDLPAIPPGVAPAPRPPHLHVCSSAPSERVCPSPMKEAGLCKTGAGPIPDATVGGHGGKGTGSPSCVQGFPCTDRQLLAAKRPMSVRRYGVGGTPEDRSLPMSAEETPAAFSTPVLLIPPMLIMGCGVWGVDSW